MKALAICGSLCSGLGVICGVGLLFRGYSTMDSGDLAFGLVVFAINAVVCTVFTTALVAER